MKEKKKTRFPYCYTTSFLLFIIKAPLHLYVFFFLMSYPPNPSFFSTWFLRHLEGKGAERMIAGNGVGKQ